MLCNDTALVMLWLVKLNMYNEILREEAPRIPVPRGLHGVQSGNAVEISLSICAS